MNQFENMHSMILEYEKKTEKKITREDIVDAVGEKNANAYFAYLDALDAGNTPAAEYETGGEFFDAITHYLDKLAIGLFGADFFHTNIGEFKAPPNLGEKKALNPAPIIEQKSCANDSTSVNKSQVTESTTALMNADKPNKNLLPPPAQVISNLPAELLTQPRFFPVLADKNPIVKGWSNPKNQSFHTDIKLADGQLVGFDICSHNSRAGYICVDVDHCFNDDGELVSEEIARWVNLFFDDDGNAVTYAEKSISGRGLHFLFKPANPAEYKEFVGIKRLHVGNAAVEVFWEGTGRYILLTGDVYHCAAGTQISTDVDAVELIWNQIFSNEQKEKSNKSSTTYKSTSKLPHALDIARVHECLKFIEPARISENYFDWLAVTSSIKQTLAACGMSDAAAFAVFDDWCKKDNSVNPSGKPRYDYKKNLASWQSLHDTNFDIGVLIKKATDAGYCDKEFRLQWYEDNPAYKAYEDFGDELVKAVEFLKSIDKNVLSLEVARDTKILWQVALCLEYNFTDIADAFINHVVAAGFWNRRDLTRELNRVQKSIKKIRADKAAVRADLQKQFAHDRLAELQAMPPSPERDAELISHIKNMLSWRVDPKTKKRISPRITNDNAEIIFTYDPCINRLFGFDEFAEYEVFLKNPIWDNHSAGRPIEDADIDRLKFYIGKNYNDFNSDKLIEQCITEFSRRNAFHKVKDYLNNLPSWDGTPRAESLFIDYLGVKNSRYSREVSLKWLIAAVSRIFHSGCNFQWALVLNGAQGIGKSHVLEKLGAGFFCKLVTSFDSDKAAAEIIRASWLIEIEEFAAGRRAEISTAKSFLSKSFDEYRPSYGRRAKIFQRHQVFAVTCNGQSFLRDLTGNRRFAILECGKRQGDWAGLLTDDFIAQIWAEVMVKAMELFKDGFNAELLNLSTDARLTAELTAEKFVSDDGLTLEIKSFLDILIPPRELWILLTQDERRQFFERGSVFIYKDDVNARIEHLPPKYKNDDSFMEQFKNLLDSCHSDNDATGKPFLRLYGSHQRQTICASEILHECFSPTDRRKSTSKILDVLEKLDDWQQGERLQNADPLYRDQKKVYYRVTTTDNSN